MTSLRQCRFAHFFLIENRHPRKVTEIEDFRNFRKAMGFSLGRPPADNSVRLLPPLMNKALHRFSMEPSHEKIYKPIFLKLGNGRSSQGHPGLDILIP